MKEMQWGFIGCGNMAKAMIRGMVEHHAVEAAQVMASDALAAAMEPVQALGVQTTGDNKEVAAKSRYLVLAVKPQQFDTVIGEIRDAMEIRKPEQSTYINAVNVTGVSMDTGEISVEIKVEDGCYYEMLSDLTGTQISGEYDLIHTVRNLAMLQKEYESVKDALASVKNERLRCSQRDKRRNPAGRSSGNPAGQ